MLRCPKGSRVKKTCGPGLRTLDVRRADGRQCCAPEAIPLPRTLKRCPAGSRVHKRCPEGTTDVNVEREDGHRCCSGTPVRTKTRTKTKPKLKKAVNKVIAAQRLERARRCPVGSSVHKECPAGTKDLGVIRDDGHRCCKPLTAEEMALLDSEVDKAMQIPEDQADRMLDIDNSVTDSLKDMTETQFKALILKLRGQPEVAKRAAVQYKRFTADLSRFSASVANENVSVTGEVATQVKEFNKLKHSAFKAFVSETLRGEEGALKRFEARLEDLRVQLRSVDVSLRQSRVPVSSLSAAPNASGKWVVMWSILSVVVDILFWMSIIYTVAMHDVELQDMIRDTIIPSIYSVVGALFGESSPILKLVQSFVRNEIYDETATKHEWWVTKTGRWGRMSRFYMKVGNTSMSALVRWAEALLYFAGFSAAERFAMKVAISVLAFTIGTPFYLAKLWLFRKFRDRYLPFTPPSQNDEPQTHLDALSDSDTLHDTAPVAETPPASQKPAPQTA